MTLEKRLIIDVRYTREAFDQKAIGKLGWIRREYNFTDPMTNIAISTIMRDFMAKYKIDCVFEQYVIRSNGKDSITSESEYYLLGRNVENPKEQSFDSFVSTMNFIRI